MQKLNEKGESKLLSIDSRNKIMLSSSDYGKNPSDTLLIVTKFEE